MSLETDRLETITQQIHRTLEKRLAAVLGDIQAVREIAQLIHGTDADVARYELLKDQLSGRLDAAAPGESDDLRRRIAGHAEHVAALGALRGELVDALAAVATDLEASS